MSQWKRKAEASEHNWCAIQICRVLKRLFKPFTTLGKKERVLLKPGCYSINKWKQKTSQSLPTEEKWMLQAIRRVYYQVFYSSRVDETIIRDILLQGNGWIVGNENKKFVYDGSLVRF